MPAEAGRGGDVAHASTSAEALAPELPLEGWKGIARAVGVSERTARRLGARPRDPLPVWHYLGRLVAFPSALREWRAREMRRG